MKYEVPSYEEVRDLRRSVAKLENDLTDLQEDFQTLVMMLKEEREREHTY